MKLFAVETHEDAYCPPYTVAIFTTLIAALERTQKPDLKHDFFRIKVWELDNKDKFRATKTISWKDVRDGKLCTE